MFRIVLPFSDGSLLLTPRLGFLSRYGQAIVLFLLLFLLLFLIFRLYHYELQFINRKAARSLLGLRLVIVGLIFFVVGMKPSMRYTATRVIPSRILVSVDRSDSMSITDPQRDPIEKLELARGLKLATDIADDKRIAGWIEQLKNLEPPGDEAYRRVIERVDSAPRKQLAERVLTSEGVGLLKTLAQSHNIDLIGFTHQLSELNELRDDYDRVRSVLATDGRKPGSAYTDLKIPLRRALEQRADFQEGLLGVVILSDGQHNWGELPGNLAYQLGNTDNKARIPVYAVVCGAKVPPTDLAITSLKANPPTVFKHGIANIDVRMLANNIPEGRLKITVTYPPAPDLPERKPIVEYVDHDGATQPLPRSIPVKMDRTASETLTVTVEALPKDGSKVEDRFPENNTGQVTINVAPDKAKVLVIDGEARWELHYLHTALIRDETMETKSVVFDQPRIDVVREEDLKELKLPNLKLPGPDELLRNDCIIIGDVSAEQLPLEERVRLEKFVADRGGTLVILAGKRSMPFEFLKENDPIARMLPIDAPRIVEKKSGFRLALTGEGMQTGFLRLEPELGSSQERWAKLPPHFWGVVGQAKKGAVTLAYYPGGMRDGTSEQEHANALIARQNYGFGRVVFVGLDSTWRWRYKQGDKYHHRFWSQVIRWAASDRPMTAANEHVRFGVREPVYRADQEVEMIVRLSGTVKKLDIKSLAGARLYRKTKPNAPEEAIALSKLTAHPFVPGELDGVQANLPPGEYSMELVIPDIDEKLNDSTGKKLRASFRVLPPDTAEMLNLATNWERMKEIADKSGGELYSADRAGELLQKLQSRTATREETTDKNLWQSWWLLVPLLCLLTLEWVIRKFSGLT